VCNEQKENIDNTFTVVNSDGLWTARCFEGVGWVARISCDVMNVVVVSDNKARVSREWEREEGVCVGELWVGVVPRERESERERALWAVTFAGCGVCDLSH